MVPSLTILLIRCLPTAYDDMRVVLPAVTALLPKCRNSD
jgi:hypothetical protein